MRRKRKAGNIFIEMAFSSFVALVGIVVLMFVFAKLFGELAIPAIDVMIMLSCISMVTLGIGIIGGILSWNSDR